jgi:hypothetical protein
MLNTWLRSLNGFNGEIIKLPTNCIHERDFLVEFEVMSDTAGPRKSIS